ncbi:MAG: glycerophosphodiester phosphodiesterase [Actinomycetota bacterium]|nr:glycerophosphodiester phosphodiesterase [Actinomycetota bacterium]
MNRMLVYGHRGACVDVRPNTVEAYGLAIEQGADGVELDVRRTRDDAIVIFHDDRSAPDATPFVELNLSEIKATTPWVPTLDEAWDALGPNALLNIEIKNIYGQADYDPTQRVAAGVVRWIAAHDTGDRILVSSFNTMALDAVKALDPSIRTGLLSMSWLDPMVALQQARDGGHVSSNLSLIRTLDEAKRIVQAAGGLDVLVWTVNDPHHTVRLADAGVAGIFTDDPGLMVKTLSDGE